MLNLEADELQQQQTTSSLSPEKKTLAIICVRYSQKTSIVTSSQFDRGPLGYGGMEYLHHKYASNKSAPTV